MTGPRRRSGPKKRAQNPYSQKFHLPLYLCRKLGFLFSPLENRETFFRRIGAIFPPTDPRYKLIDKAYDTAKKEFEKKKRDNGVRYFEHLRGVALILLVYMRVRDANLIAAGLLHDLVEDIRGWTTERVARQFNEEIAANVFWMTRPRRNGTLRTEYDIDRMYHQQLNNAPRDPILGKMADRLYNLATLPWGDKARIRRKIAETRDFYLPLAEKHFVLVHEIEDILKYIECRLDQ